MRPENKTPFEALLEEAGLGPDDFCRVAGVELRWVRERVESGLLGPAPETGWRFETTLRRARRMALLERHFDAVPELAAMVADLEDEIERLRLHVRRLGG